MPFTDPTGGYKCFPPACPATISLDAVPHSNGYSFQVEMTHKLWRQGMKVVEVPIVFTDSLSRLVPRWSGHIIREAFFMVWRLWMQNGMRRRPSPETPSN